MDGWGRRVENCSAHNVRTGFRLPGLGCSADTYFSLGGGGGGLLRTLGLSGWDSPGDDIL